MQWEIDRPGTELKPEKSVRCSLLTEPSAWPDPAGDRFNSFKWSFYFKGIMIDDGTDDGFESCQFGVSRNI